MILPDSLMVYNVVCRCALVVLDWNMRMRRFGVDDT